MNKTSLFRIETTIRYTNSMKKKLRAAVISLENVVTISVDMQTGYVYLLVSDRETALYYYLLGSDRLSTEIGL